MPKNNDWKKRDGVVYSTNQNFDYQYRQNDEAKTPMNAQQKLRVAID